MGNLESYVRWRGDLSFTERPFCEVDNLAFCELSYFDFAGIVPELGSGKSVALREVAERFKAEERNNAAAFGLPPTFLYSMASSKRYRDIRFLGFKEVLDNKEKCEFAALTIQLDQNTAFVAYRGTSDALTGWEEDFRMSFQAVPAQHQAADYLHKIISSTEGTLYVGGHSKGGNLAVYAAMMCPEGQDRIASVYCNDGPGFCPQLLDSERYEGIKSKIIRIVPEFCVVGKLFENHPPDKIVASSATGFMQHSSGSWQIEGDQFCTKQELSSKCKMINQIFDTWIESASMDQRRAFVEELFAAMSADGITKLSDLSNDGVDKVENILLRMTTSSSEGAKAVIIKFVSSAVERIQRVDVKELICSKEIVRGIISFLLGLFFMGSPHGASNFVGLALCGLVLVVLGKRILANFDTHNSESGTVKIKATIQLVLFSVVSFSSAVINLIFNFTNLLVGIFFLVTAFGRLKKAVSSSKAKIDRGINSIIAFMALCLGIVPIVSQGLLWDHYAFTAGTFIVIFGIMEIVEAMYQQSKLSK